MAKVQVGVCGLVIAFFSAILGLIDVGLWVTCYFECQTGREIEFNYFSAIWTGALAFVSGFMMTVLFCIKFRFLGSFTVVITFILVPCEIFCACIYGYRAYLSRDHLELDVPLYAAMSVCGVVLFVITIMWNCYYCCIATPQEDYEEQVLEEQEEEEKKQKVAQEAAQIIQETFTNNPIIDDEYRNTQPISHGPFYQPKSNRSAESRHLQQTDYSRGQLLRTGQSWYPQSQPLQTGRDRQTNGRGGHRHVNRPSDYPHAALQDYPYPPAFTRERAPQQPIIERADVHRNVGRGQINRGYEPDAYGQPIIEEASGAHGYVFDGARGQQSVPYRQTGLTPPPEYSSHNSRRHPNQQVARSYHDPNLYPWAEQRQQDDWTGLWDNRGGNRVTARYGQPSSSGQGVSVEDRSHIYRPRPENFRGKPRKPEYVQQVERLQDRASVARSEGDLGAYSAEYSAHRGTVPASDAYF